MRDDRQSGKTTRLIERAIDLAAVADVVVTGPHSKWVLELEREFRDLVGVHFRTISQIRSGRLRGIRGYLLIDDVWDISSEDYVRLAEEAKIMAVGLPEREQA